MIGIILAGGENRRMGADKAFLVFRGKPIVEHVIAVHRELFDSTIVVTRSPERYREYAVVVVEDAHDRRGPLTGLYSGMLHSPDAYHFVSACDMPHLNARLITFLSSLVEGYDAVVPVVNGFPEPLHAIYHRNLLPVIESRLRGGHQKVQRLFDCARVRYVSDAEMGPYDPGLLSFKNINTPKEYEEVVCSDWECRN